MSKKEKKEEPQRYMCLNECYYKHHDDDIRPIHYMPEQTKRFSSPPKNKNWILVDEVEIDFEKSSLDLLMVSSEWEVVDAVPFLQKAGFDIDVDNAPPKEKLVMMISEARTRIEAQKIVERKQPKTAKE